MRTVTATPDGHTNRRTFLTSGAAGILGTVVTRCPAGAAEDAPDKHNMLVFGERAIFLSHLPMFEGLNQAGTAFTSHHRYQVILQAAFTRQGEDRGDLYLKDRQAHPATRMYTLEPDLFVLSRLFTPVRAPALTSFAGKVFRGHLEQGGVSVPGLEDLTVKVVRVVHGRMFDPRVKRPDALEYLLIGHGSERFLVHTIVAPPSFDQVLAVKSSSRELVDLDIGGDARVSVKRRDVAGERLREGERVQATLRLGSAPGAAMSTIPIEVGSQVYFEEGELLMPHTFQPTAEERRG